MFNKHGLMEKPTPGCAGTLDFIGFRMNGARLVPPHFVAVSPTGVPYAGGKLYFYVSGTDTPLPVYSDVALSVPLTNPVIANSAGDFGDIFLQTTPYRVTLTDASDNQIYNADPVTPFGYGNVTVTGNLSVTGTTTFTGAAAFNSTVNLGSVNATTLTTTGNAVVGGNGRVNGQLVVDSEIVNGSFLVSGGCEMDSGFTSNNNAGIVGSLTVTGSVTASSYLNSSDKRTKTNISAITPSSAWTWIMSAEPVTYNQADRPGVAGFIAQTDKANGRGSAVFETPNKAMVADGEDSPDGIQLTRDYTVDTAYMTAALQDLQKRLTALESK